MPRQPPRSRSTVTPPLQPNQLRLELDLDFTAEYLVLNNALQRPLIIFILTPHLDPFLRSVTTSTRCSITRGWVLPSSLPGLWMEFHCISLVSTPIWLFCLSGLVLVTWLHSSMTSTQT